MSTIAIFGSYVLSRRDGAQEVLRDYWVLLEGKRIAAVTPEYINESLHHSLHRLSIPPYVRIFRIHGPFLFGATDKIDVVTENIHKLPPVVILRLRNMTALDATGLFALEEVARTLKASGRELILCGAREQPLQLIQQTEFENLVGPENICDNVQEALSRAEEAFERLQPAGKATTAR